MLAVVGMRLNDGYDPLVLDTSVWINVFATQEGDRIVRALKRTCLAPHQVVAEVLRDPITGIKYTASNHPLSAGGAIEITSLVADELDTFLELVGAPIGDRLGDGEAAAMAVAIHRKAVLCVDERKARRILRERFSAVEVMGSIDLLRHPSVLDDLGDKLAAECEAKATKFGRMHIPRSAN